MNSLEASLLEMLNSGIQAHRDEMAEISEGMGRTVEGVQPPKWVVDMTQKLHGMIVNRLKVAPVQNLVDLKNLEPKEALTAISQALAELGVEKDRLRNVLRQELMARESGSDPMH